MHSLSSSYTVEGRIAAQYIVKHLGLDSIAVVAPTQKPRYKLMHLLMRLIG